VQRYGLLDLAPLAREVVVERMADALIVLDAQGRVLDMNAAALRYFGRLRPQVLGLPFFSLLDLSPTLRQACEPMQPAQGEITVGAGVEQRSYELRVMPLLDSRQRPAGSTVVMADITVRRRAEMQIRENLVLFTTLIDNLRMGILAEGPDGRVVHLNQLMAARLSADEDPSALLGRPVAAFWGELREQMADPEQFARAVLDPVARGQTVLGAEVRLLDGRICECDSVPTQGDGSAVGRLWICRDVTERIQFEARLRHTHKMEAIGQLAGGIAHEFNNLLTVINGYSQYMQTQLDPRDALYADAETIVRAGLRAAELTGQMLAFSRRQRLDVRVIDLNEVLAEVGRMLRRVIGEQVEVALDLAPDLGAVEADSGYIEQVVMNLATNARDAMPTGGTLTISTRNLDLKEPLPTGTTVVPAGRHVVLQVRDTGQGMDQEPLRHMFEPFFTTKAPGKGTGLGLAMIHGIVEQLGGQIAIESAAHAGTAITIYLPRSAAQAPPADSGYPQLPPPRGHETILLVEDQDDVRAALHDMLVRLGYRVIVESGGRGALSLLRADGRAADLVLTDVVMPGMSGRQLGDALGELCPHLPVLYMSGHPDDVLSDYDALSLGDRLMAKPLSINELARRLRQEFGAPSNSA
jgi:PAS domain S-box-containing protein